MYLLGVAPSQLPPGLFAVWDPAKSTNPTNPVTAAILRKESSEEEQVGKKIETFYRLDVDGFMNSNSYKIRECPGGKKLML